MESEHLSRTGILTKEEFRSLLPKDETRRKARPYVVTECVQEIPCNPCANVCPFGAIFMKDINSTPSVNFEKCTGCMSCIRYCPGLAIFGIDETKEKAVITLAYEMLDVPLKGEKVAALDREGHEVGEAVVTRVMGGDKWEGTHVVSIEVDLSLIYEVRGFRRKQAFGRERV